MPGLSLDIVARLVSSKSVYWLSWSDPDLQSEDEVLKVHNQKFLEVISAGGSSTIA